MMLRNSWYEQTAGKLCKCSKSKKILKNIWLQLKLVKLRRHINKGKIVIHIRLQKNCWTKLDRVIGSGPFSVIIPKLFYIVNSL
jgi:hypothetical protein